MKYDEQRKQVDLPPDTVKVLEKLAKEERNSLKGYMEKILIDHAKQKSAAKDETLPTTIH